VNKSEFSRALAERSDMSAVEAGKVVDKFLGLIQETLQAGEKVSFLGFGSFEVVQREGRVGVNPRDPTKKVEIAPRKAVRFAPGTPLKAAVNPPPAPAKKATKKATKKK
jgi:DNA-binding protein HU-beta